MDTRWEPTLPLDYEVCKRNIGFRSKWPTRLYLWWLALTFRAIPIVITWDDVMARGYVDDYGVYFITRVRSTRRPA